MGSPQQLLLAVTEFTVGPLEPEGLTSTPTTM